MKSSSITGLAYSFIPNDTTNQTTYTTVSAFTKDLNVVNNNFYLFAGPMPASDVLQTYNDSAKLLADYSSSLITKILGFDLKYTYDEVSRTRKLQKFPVNAKTVASSVDGVIGWCAIEMQPVAVTSSYHCFVFTDAIGGWDDADQSILVSSTTVVKGENLTIKDINITLRDSLLIDL